MVVTKETKYSFQFEPNGKPVDEACLLNLIRNNGHRFPHVAETELIDVAGEVGRSGLVINDSSGLIFGAVRAPSFIPTRINHGQVEYGGPQTEQHLERSFLTARSDEFVARHAASIIKALETPGTNLEELAEFNEGAGAGGSEPEAWILDIGGNPVNIQDGGELQTCLAEETIEPIANPYKFMRQRAAQILARKRRYPGQIIVDTSSLPVGSPAQMQVNDNGEIGSYVQAIQDIFYHRFMHNYHPTSKTLMDQLAQVYCFSDWQDLHDSLGNMAYLVFAASHLSIGLPHLRSGIEGMYIPEQEAIAVADIFNTNLATLVELLMFSTPVVFNFCPQIRIAETELWPRDVRSIMRYALDTTYPAPFILTSQNYRQTITRQIIEGYSHTLDRAAFMATIRDPKSDTTVSRPVMHGRARIRAASNEPKNMTGRVEFTGCSASFSLYDETARNCLLQVLMVAAYDALAHQQHPVGYYKEIFPNLGRWQEQQDLAIEASLYGFNTPRIKQLVEEGIRFLNYMQNRFAYTQENGVNSESAISAQCIFARERLQNLLAVPAGSLAEYLRSPKGPIAEVVQNELRSGQSPLAVTRKIENYQLTLAEKILS